ncbi:MAG: endonuclease/exonuclease/phosphatase family protein, partial [Bacteroidia bacterium]|nr:endonuclease/exonuclease/phosphatase family protein [Bacteroidia bacterium]
YLLLFNIIFAVVWAVLLKYEALISVVAIALGITHLSNYIKIGKPTGNREGTFKVMSYNVRLFNNYESRNISSEKKVISFLKEQKPDIICLQEFYVNGIPVQKDQEIKEALGGKYYSHMKLMGSGKNRYYGIVTYSKYPIISKGQLTHPGSSSLTIFSDVVIEHDTFRIFNNHLQSFRLKKMERSFVEEMTDPADNESLETMKNLSLSLRQGFVRRARQADVVKARIDKSPYPVIVTGDFNDTPVSYSYRKIRKGLKDSFVDSGYGAGFTYRGKYPANRIDYILYNNVLESRYFEILKVRYSDHYPVIAYLKKLN